MKSGIGIGIAALGKYFETVVPARYFQSPRVRRDGRIHEAEGYVVYTSLLTGREYKWVTNYALVDENGILIARLHIASNGLAFVCRMHGPTASIFQVAGLRDGYHLQKAA